VTGRGRQGRARAGLGGEERARWASDAATADAARVRAAGAGRQAVRCGCVPCWGVREVQARCVLSLGGATAPRVGPDREAAGWSRRGGAAIRHRSQGATRRRTPATSALTRRCGECRHSEWRHDQRGPRQAGGRANPGTASGTDGQRGTRPNGGQANGGEDERRGYSRPGARRTRRVAEQGRPPSQRGGGSWGFDAWLCLYRDVVASRRGRGHQWVPAARPGRGVGARVGLHKESARQRMLAFHVKREARRAREGCSGPCPSRWCHPRRIERHRSDALGRAAARSGAERQSAGMGGGSVATCRRAHRGSAVPSGARFGGTAVPL
jgi:hypothetical protein